ncbi:MAG: hypothetical protein ACKPKO_33925 [Candidatus Fonsibacter sp.]
MLLLTLNGIVSGVGIDCFALVLQDALSVTNPGSSQYWSGTGTHTVREQMPIM